MSLCSINITIGVEEDLSIIKVGDNNRLTGLYGQLYDDFFVYKDQR